MARAGLVARSARAPVGATWRACPPCCPGCGDSCAPEIRQQVERITSGARCTHGQLFRRSSSRCWRRLDCRPTCTGLVHYRSTRQPPDSFAIGRNGSSSADTASSPRRSPATQAREREPALGPLVKHAISTPQWAHVSDPKAITDRLLQWLRLHGVAVRRGEALGAEGRMLRTDGRQCSCRSTCSSSRPARGRGGSPARSAIACCWKASVATTPPFPSPVSSCGPR